MREVELETPYGKPSGPIAIGAVGGEEVAFLPRHGPRHTLPPAAINYRANLWAFKELGVERVLAPTAAGSLQKQVKPGEFVVCDQFVDRTWGRADSFHPEGPRVAHVAAADPYCPVLRQLAVEVGRELGVTMHDGGTVVVIQGPRFSTRAESRWYQDAGFDVVNMTAYPEAILCRELELCYATVAMVTDHDVGVAGAEPVSAERVGEVFAQNNERLRELLLTAIPRIGEQPQDACATALASARI